MESDYASLMQNAHQSDRVEVIKLPPTINSNGAYNLTKSASSHSKDTNLVDSANDWTAAALNFSAKAMAAQSSADDSDAPLNLCTKTEPKSNDLSSESGSNSLQSLSCITAALGSGSGNDRMRKF